MDNIHTQKLMNEKNELMRELLKTQKQLNEMRQQVQQYQALVASMQETYMPSKKEEIKHDPSKGVFGGPAKDQSLTKHDPSKGVFGGPGKPEEGNKPQESNKLIPNKMRLRESHTHSQLIKLSADELKRLKTKYTNKIQSATKAGKHAEVKHHKKELNDIKGIMISRNKIKKP